MLWSIACGTLNTTRETLAHLIAPEHITHGSVSVYKVYPSKEKVAVVWQ